MLNIQIELISEEGTPFKGQVDFADISIPSGAGYRNLSYINYDLVLQNVSGQIIVKGKLTLDVDLECSKCSDFFSTTMQDSSFLRAYACSDCGESLDLAPGFREALLLSWPGYPVCREDCQGLCATCRVNLNRSSCTCSIQESDGRWGTLDNLKMN